MTEHTHPAQADCCRDFARASLSRRSLLQGAAAVGGGMAVTQMFGEAMMQSSFAGTPGGNTMVVISLRGGVDGLGVVVPHGDPAYYKARPSTAVAAGALLCKDAMFGLHPVDGPPGSRCGSPASSRRSRPPASACANRSHFAAIEEVEDAAPGSDARSGWINRMIGLGPRNGTLDAVQLGMNFPTTALVGPHPTLATQDLDGLLVPGTRRPFDPALRLTGRPPGPPRPARSHRAHGKRSPSRRVPARSSSRWPRARRPTPRCGTRLRSPQPLKNAAKLIRADIGTDVIAIDAGNWDLHTDYGTIEWGSMQSNISGFAQALAAFMDGPRRPALPRHGRHHLRVRPPRRRRTAARASTTAGAT